VKLLEKIFGSYADKELKKLRPIVDQVLSYDEAYSKLSDKELIAKTQEFKDRLAQGATLDDILPEAFATCREAAWRVLGMKHYPVQILGGIVLHQGRIAEMRTGEGKTLVATLPAYLNALSGKGVHVVTVNDYLAKRDSEQMGKVYSFLGLTVGLVIQANSTDKKSAYAADITYGTNNEFGFDYLRDNMVIYKDQMVQRGHNFCIVDEVDSILIDEARTPLIISGQGDKSTELYRYADMFVRTLEGIRIKEEDTKELYDDYDCDYIVDEKAKTVSLTARGIRKAERGFNVENITDPEHTTLLHHINQALKAHGTMHNEVDYIVRDGEVLIVDEFTGRIMEGRRYSEGLHQAIEAKEGVTVRQESKTLATITFQNYFRMYKKLSGMTGTALTEEAEFKEIYKLDVIPIPTNKPMIREDMSDVVYKTEKAKFNAIVEEIKECHAKGQPVLVGTVSIEKSELLSSLLKRNGIKHEVLNAKYHEKEAEIVAQAGKFGAVTIATNMAGRGTDILLGGNAEFMAKAEMKKQGFDDNQIAYATSFFETEDEEILQARQTFKELESKFKKQIEPDRQKVIEAGGLYIIGTERHESRRIDNQLRGRAGRQGDPGRSRFFLSLEDDLMRLFGSEKIQGLVNMIGLEDDQPIEHRMLTGSIETAQSKVEGRNFGIRKHVLQYDDVMNEQRKIIYAQRQKVLDGENVRSNIMAMLHDVIVDAVARHNPADGIMDNYDFNGLRKEFLGYFLTEDDLQYTPDQLNDLTDQQLVQDIEEKAVALYQQREQEFGEELMREAERVILLQNVDKKWMAHIDDMDQLKKGITLRSYGQRDPAIEFKFEGFDMFDHMIQSIKADTVKMLYRLRLEQKEAPQREQVADIEHTQRNLQGDSAPVQAKSNKVGRNDPCPCGSGKKYKNCCGR
jgi:preprotein translocase subunit SecA